MYRSHNKFWINRKLIPSTIINFFADPDNKNCYARLLFVSLIKQQQKTTKLNKTNQD